MNIYNDYRICWKR